MKVANWMNTHPITIHPDESVATARALLEKFRINQLPVVKQWRLVGIVTDRDLRDAFPSVFSVAAASAGQGRPEIDPTRLRVSAVLTAKVLTLAPDDTVAHAAALMRDERIGALPVIEDGRVVGMLTRSDVLAAFLDANAHRSARVSHLAAVATGDP
jgi:acetoin utilization protein AcuB